MAKKKNVLSTYEDYKACCNYLWDADFWTIYNKYYNIAISLWTYENLPSGIQSEFIEKNLYEFGKCLFTERKIKDARLPFSTIGTGEYLALQVQGEYNFNLYNIPTKFSGYGLNYQAINLDYDDCVYIRNNTMKLPTIENVMYYCRKIAQCEKIIDMNLNAQSMPFALKVKDKQTRLTMENFYNQMKIGKPAIFVDEKFDTDALNVVKFDAPFVADKIRIEKENYERELQTFLGINNLPVEKNERLIQGEVDSNDIIVNDFIHSQYVWRRKAVDEINEKYGLNIKVRFYNKQVEKQLELEYEQEIEKEQENNGKIYSDTENID